MSLLSSRSNPQRCQSRNEHGLICQRHSSDLSLPSGAGGSLPTWMLFISSVALFNTAQTFVSPTLSKKVYDGKPEQGDLS